MNNKDQDTQKEANISGGIRNKNDGLVIEITKIVRRPEIQSSTQCLIYKVPRHIRKWKEEAYTPQVISIGPIHHKNKRLKAMEEYKERYLKSFVQNNVKDLEFVVGKIRTMEESIRGCYAETIDLSSDKFVKMILVDACFILELLIRFFTGLTSDDPMFVEPRATAVMHDLLLLENQLPFFVIEKLYHLAFPSPSDYDYNLFMLWKNYFAHFKMKSAQAHPNMKIEHFTDLLRTFQIPPLEERPKRREPDPQEKDLLYTATQLHEAGVKFQVVKESECHFDIKFEKGVLKIPQFLLDDWTEVVTRNIMALEQIRYVEDTYFTDNFFLMDSLINTGKDVNFLCEKEILVNYLGDNNAPISMINNLNKGITFQTVRDDYVDLHKKLNGFYENRWHRWKATLKHEYFSTPWRGASTVAAIILLVLTFIQTACSIFK